PTPPPSTSTPTPETTPVTFVDPGGNEFDLASTTGALGVNSTIQAIATLSVRAAIGAAVAGVITAIVPNLQGASNREALEAATNWKTLAFGAFFGIAGGYALTSRLISALLQVLALESSYFAVDHAIEGGHGAAALYYAILGLLPITAGRIGAY